MATLEMVRRSLPLLATALVALFLPALAGKATNAGAAEAASGISINCGGPDVGSFVADRYFGSAECCGATGIAAATDALIDTSTVNGPAPMEVYQTDRRGRRFDGGRALSGPAALRRDRLEQPGSAPVQYQRVRRRRTTGRQQL